MSDSRPLLIRPPARPASPALPQALAAQIGAHSSAVVRTTTRTLRMAQEEQMERALQREADAQAVCYASPEFRARLETMLAEKAKK